MPYTSSEQWIEMTVYNKLKIAILTIMTSQAASAITLTPIQIQSGSGDLLYAEMKFSNANPNEKIEVGLADTEDMMSVGFANQPPGHLNFYTRRSNDGTGVIVITSSRPMVDAELNILLKVKEGSATHLQQIKTALTRGRPNPPTAQLNATRNEKLLTPQMIVSEKDIALNLPSSTSYQTNSAITTSTPSTVKSISSTNTQRPLVISVATPPTLQSLQKAATQVTTSNPVTTSNNNKSNTQTITQQAVVTPVNATQPIQNVQKMEQKPEVATIKPKVETAKTETTKAKPEVTKSESEKPQTETTKTETAKAEPAKVKTETAKTEPAKAKPKTENAKAAPSAKQQIKNNNNDPGHVVQANESLWTIASRIAAETHQSIPEVMKQIKENNANAFIQGDINRIRRGAALNLAASYKQTPQVKYKTPTAPITTRKQSGSAKYRLDQAEMSLIADNEQNSSQGSAKKNIQANQTNTELSTKVMTSREKTVKLQNKVTQLASALQEKNRRIQLLNARLAQLQQQLQQQNVKQPKS